MSRTSRSAAVMLAAPLLAAVLLLTPAAHAYAWTIGRSDYLYEYTDQRWKTIVPVTNKAVTGEVTALALATNCAPDAFQAKRNRTLQPSQVLASIPYGVYNCSSRTAIGNIGNVGTVPVFGNFMASVSVYPVGGFISG